MGPKERNLPYQTVIKTLRTFSDNKIPYVIVGGAALALHGIPRSTLDVDIIVPATRETITALFEVIRHVGLSTEDIVLSSFEDKSSLLIGQWVSFEDREKRQLLDVFFEDDQSFNELARRAVKRIQEETVLYVASLFDLEKMKRESDRSIDKADTVLIEELRSFTKEQKQKILDSSSGVSIVNSMGREGGYSRDKDRRLYKRLCMAVTVEYSFCEGTPGYETGFTKDISNGGICLLVKEEIAAGKILALKVYLPDGRGVIASKVKVVWAEPVILTTDKNIHYNTGLEFIDIMPEDRRRIFLYSEPAV